MKFKYYEQESKLFDLMQLPQLFYTNEPRNSSATEEMNEATLLNLIQDPEYRSTMTMVKERLTPYQSTIEMFYANEFMSAYDVYLLLTYCYSITGYTSIDAYLDDILNQKEDLIKENLLLSLLATEQDKDNIIERTFRVQAQSILEKHERLMSFIKDLSTASNYKWHLLMMLESPKKYLQTFKELMQKVTPIYEQLFHHAKEDMLKLAESFMHPKDLTPAAYFEQMTNQAIASNVLKDDENCLLISVVFPYSFMKNVQLNGEYIIWGLKMEDGFKLINEQKDTLIQQRIMVFKNLGDKTRYEVLRLIATGITSTKEIAERLDVSSATVSYHINAFFTSKVIILSKSKKAKYEVNIEMLEELWEAFIKDMMPKNVSQNQST